MHSHCYDRQPQRIYWGKTHLKTQCKLTETGRRETGKNEIQNSFPFY